MISGLTTSSLPRSVTHHLVVPAVSSVVATPDDSLSNTRTRLLYAITLTPFLRPFLCCPISVRSDVARSNLSSKPKC